MIISFVFYFFLEDYTVNRVEGIILFTGLILFLFLIVKIRKDDSNDDISDEVTLSNLNILVYIITSSFVL